MDRSTRKVRPSSRTFFAVLAGAALFVAIAYLGIFTGTPFGEVPKRAAESGRHDSASASRAGTHRQSAKIPERNPVTAVCTIRGIVVDEFEHPLSGAKVVLDGGPTDDAVSTVKSDSHGGFRFADVGGGDGYHLRATASGYEDAKLGPLRIASPLEYLTLVLPREVPSGGIVYGWIEDDSGFPLPGLHCRLIDPSGKERLSMLSDERGHFEFADYAPVGWQPGFSIVVSDPTGRWKEAREPIKSRKCGLWFRPDRADSGRTGTISVIFDDPGLRVLGEKVSIQVFGRNPSRFQSVTMKLRHGHHDFTMPHYGEYLVHIGIGEYTQLVTVHLKGPEEIVRVDPIPGVTVACTVRTRSGEVPRGVVASLVLKDHAMIPESTDMGCDEYTLATADEVTAWPPNRLEFRSRPDPSTGRVVLSDVPPGAYVLQLHGGHYDSIGRDVEVTGRAERMDLGTMEMVPCSGVLDIHLEFEQGPSSFKHLIRVFRVDGYRSEGVLEAGVTSCRFSGLPEGRYGIYIGTLAPPDSVVHVEGTIVSADGNHYHARAPVKIDISRAPIRHVRVLSGGVSRIRIHVLE